MEDKSIETNLPGSLWAQSQGNVNRLELLAPAGDAEKLRTAIQYGADAVYLAVQDFGLRASAGNFTLTGLQEAIHYAHERDVSVYLTLNIFAHQQEIGMLRNQIRDLAATGPDAVIVSDPGIFALVRETASDMPIHISTQANVTNAQSCRFWHEQGARRIILARELTLAEIRSIRAEVPESLELEAFVHGAMCLAYSGRCLLSSFMTGRDSNRGRCAQPCRWQYLAVEQKRPDMPIEISGDARGSYIFNAKDLCMIEHIPELAASGLTSLKIEGRIKSAFYVATVVKAYREAIDAWLTDPVGYAVDPAWLEDLQKTVHRPFDTGFYFQKPQEIAQTDPDDLNQREAAVVGIIRAWLPDSSLALVEQRNKIMTGDVIEWVEPRGRHRTLVAQNMLDLERQPLTSTPHPRMFYYLPMPEAATPGAFLLKIGDKDKPQIKI